MMYEKYVEVALVLLAWCKTNWIQWKHELKIVNDQSSFSQKAFPSAVALDLTVIFVGIIHVALESEAFVV